MLSNIKTNTKWYHLYVKSLKKKKKLISLEKKIEWYLPGTGVGGKRVIQGNGHKFSVTRRISSEDLIYSMGTILNNICIFESCYESKS